ncbi:N-acetyltransferase [Aliarcobacter butzleri]|uniref:Acetyltransferase n=1 Tax=Aliarcobacter butzleri L351 TaxID=1447259 RepID=A0A837J3E3_9BACT|nr:N-acetyltransferase [Aliarcobacter butzleri]KLD99863.1 acetyltransferase [Aliarcobacter butzleri L351]KLE12093.1 acetyltransferase [Aliarcobacter butzleri L350]MDN5047440.1 N-acetyltransferase [Aliarcobacter butzleri]MDN5059132.1 N-acetyltransferase [Aliarcobacter butzleri]MDN5109446.1 N-acetyltransferase [Aliarcobacter butzleri]
MIRKLDKNDINQLLQIWLEVNIKTHNFIPKEYWEEQYDNVKELLPNSEIYVYEENEKIVAFVGLIENYIAGIFVSFSFQSKGIGKKLLDYIKEFKKELSLNVYVKNISAIKFYQREGFIINSENIDEETKEQQILMIWKSL